MLGVLLFAGLLLGGLPSVPCDAECERQAATQLLDQGDHRAATERLKIAGRRYPEDRALVLLLARSYLLEDNLFWAERTLADGVARWPDDPELRSWLASVHLRQGDPDLVTDDLEPEIAPASDPLRARWRLLSASQSLLEGDQDVAEAVLSQVIGSDTLYPEDFAAVASLRATTDPWWTAPIAGTLDLGGGYTSNALAGSPTDPGSSGEASGMVLPELRGRFMPPVRGTTRPFIDLELLGHGLTAHNSRDLSTLQAGLRLGASFVNDRRRLSVSYRTELLELNQEPSRFSDAHRLETEIEWTNGRVLFAGAGHRRYRDELRTRWEGDIGVGGPFQLGPWMSLVAGATLRLADAESPAYDQVGVSAAASAVVPLGRRTSLRLAVSAVWDDYLNSGGKEGLLVFGTEDKRRDLLGRIGVTFWAPAWRALRPGLELRATKRNSTADERPGFDFSFSEFRAVIWLRWNFATDPWKPKVAHPPGHIPLDWGLANEGAMDQERILDLLRGDEELRRGSSCSLP